MFERSWDLNFPLEEDRESFDEHMGALGTGERAFQTKWTGNRMVQYMFFEP